MSAIFWRNKSCFWPAAPENSYQTAQNDRQKNIEQYALFSHEKHSNMIKTSCMGAAENIQETKIS